MPPPPHTQKVRLMFAKLGAILVQCRVTFNEIPPPNFGARYARETVAYIFYAQDVQRSETQDTIFFQYFFPNFEVVWTVLRSKRSSPARYTRPSRRNHYETVGSRITHLTRGKLYELPRCIPLLLKRQSSVLKFWYQGLGLERLGTDLVS